MSIKNGIVLNRMYTGSYLSTNLGHEVINMFQADNGNHYLYLNSKGNFTERGKEVGTMLLVRGIGKGRVEVVGMAKNLRPVESACCTLPRDLGRINESVREKQKTFLTDVKYGKVPILDIFGEKGQQSVYVSYWVEGKDFYTPKPGNRLILKFPSSKEGTTIEKDSDIIIEINNHNFASTSLHQFILEEDEGNDFSSLTEICNNEKLWEVKNNIVINKCVDFEEYEISLFDICQIQDDENRFSNALAYFVNKYPKLLSKFLQAYLKDNDLVEIESVTREEDAKVNKDNQLWNRPTGGRIDILIRTKKYYIIIENKIGSGIIENDGITQLQRYYNYVEYLREEELVRLGKEFEIINKKLDEKRKLYGNLKNNSGKRGEKWFEEIKELDSKLKKNKEITEEVKDRKTIGVVLAPNYNLPTKNNRQIKDNNAIYTFCGLKYSKLHKWISDNAKNELENDSNFTAFHNAMKKHTYEYENEALYDDMKNKFFSRINEFKNKNNA